MLNYNYIIDCGYISHDRCRQKVTAVCHSRFADKTSEKTDLLQGHHNYGGYGGGGGGGGREPMENGSTNETPNEKTGHIFKRKTFHKPTYCHNCSDMLWGLTNQGMQCNGMFLTRWMTDSIAYRIK